VDTLKIDLSFVRGATSDPNDASVVTAVIAVAHSLDLRVVAQGVETEAQVELLRSLGCDAVQGFLWSPPLPAGECGPFLAAASSVPAVERAARGRGAGRRRGKRRS
jgi:EAL domain-containing protein (putative c-di-GMP-specific phosphodiesterase class I)